MSFITEQRKYQRFGNAVCEAAFSTDKVRWNDIELCDISAGGLKFLTNKAYDLETQMYFDLSLYNFLSEFSMKCEGHIVRKENTKDLNSYAVKFDNVDKYIRVQLDEVIKSKVRVGNENCNAPEDGLYSFLFSQGSGKRKLKGYR